MTFIELVFTGILIGFFAGTLSIGGGIISIPALLFIDPTITIHEAMATSMHLMAISILGSVLHHWKIQKHFLKDQVMNSFYLVIPMCWLSTTIALLLPDLILRSILVFLLLLMGLVRLFCRSHHVQTKKVNIRLVQVVCAGVGALLGIGGSIFLVPMLRYYNVPVQKCLGIAAMNTFLISINGVCIYQVNSFFYSGHILWQPIIVMSLVTPIIAFFTTQLAIGYFTTRFIDRMGTVVLFLSALLTYMISFMN